MKNTLKGLCKIMLKVPLWIFNTLRQYRKKESIQKGLDCFRHLYSLKIPGKAKRANKGYLATK